MVSVGGQSRCVAVFMATLSGAIGACAGIFDTVTMIRSDENGPLLKAMCTDQSATVFMVVVPGACTDDEWRVCQEFVGELFKTLTASTRSQQLITHVSSDGQEAIYCLLHEDSCRSA